MTNKELFIECYNAHLGFEIAIGFLRSAKVYTDESDFNTAFYQIFDASVSKVLTEEGSTHFYENILFEGLELEEVLESLDEYFVEDCK
jgi:hypothetical protein